VDYAFTHRVWYVAVDLDELEAVDGASRLLAIEGWAPLRLLGRDHFDRDQPRPLRAAVRAHLHARAPAEADAWRTTLITYPRAFGHVFNPVSFYLSHDAAGTLCHVIAEVHNTHGEREIYDFDPDEPGARVFTASARKRFYVSPFIGSEAEYRLSVVESSDQLAIAIHEVEVAGEGGPAGAAGTAVPMEGRRPALDASVRLRRLPLSDAHLARLVLADPVVPLKTVALIGWHALRMWVQGQPWDRFRPKNRYRS
jgi:DUF1365 family protein